MEAGLSRQLPERRRPDRLVSRVPATGDRFHSVEDQHPRHPPERQATVYQAPKERLLAHVGGEAHPHPAAVLQPAGQEVARRRWRLGEGETPDLAPVHLEILGRQALEAHRHRLHGARLLLLQPHAAHQSPEDRVPAGIRPFRVGPDQV